MTMDQSTHPSTRPSIFVYITHTPPPCSPLLGAHEVDEMHLEPIESPRPERLALGEHQDTTGAVGTDVAEVGRRRVDAAAEVQVVAEVKHIVAVLKEAYIYIMR